MKLWLIRASLFGVFNRCFDLNLFLFIFIDSVSLLIVIKTVVFINYSLTCLLFDVIEFV